PSSPHELQVESVDSGFERIFSGQQLYTAAERTLDVELDVEVLQGEVELRLRLIEHENERRGENLFVSMSPPIKAGERFKTHFRYAQAEPFVQANLRMDVQLVAGDQANLRFHHARMHIKPTQPGTPLNRPLVDHFEVANAV